MYDPASNAGLMFNQLPKLTLTSSNIISSNSDLLVKVARGLRNDSNITHDHQFFRKFRAGDCNLQMFADYFGNEFLQDIQNEIKDKDPKHLGAWFQVKQLVRGFRINLDPQDELANYWGFLIAHTEVEYCFIKQNYGSDDLTALSGYLREWLLVDDWPLTNATTSQNTQYIIHMVMYWAALYELFLEEHFITKDYSILSKCLPTLDAKTESSLVLSSGVMLSNVKKGWASEKYVKADIKWTELYRDVITAQLKDPDLAVRMSNVHELSHVDPDLKAIKKRFDRWRKGSLMTIDDVRANIAILRIPYQSSQAMLSSDIIIFVNMFTYIQKELIKNGVAETLIVDTFRGYSRIKKLVAKRYSAFQETNILTA
ncbi:hypothetical protein AB4166_02890 [Vibrio splendidus]|uniref:hypothetical protein n=1 Tax=Vibrio TaxID=662 RepID=UPI000C83B6AC|nr:MULTISPECIES: hypothetical protein [Vibrio]MBO7911147.1 hypothetical protein [Vibrio sp. G41H]MCF7489982.1 hypothetical protein [Vibrio sp. G-C-1]PMO50130.1 hypothetical protein BCT09_02275 [Vibrio splendidus]